MTPENKICRRCGRVIEWRKKWEKDWESIQYCSKACCSKKLSPIDQSIEEAMKAMLLKRGKSSSLCPSEPVRELFPADSWKSHMEDARMAARRLVAKGLAVITQKGKVVDPSFAKGPIRVRLK